MNWFKKKRDDTLEKESVVPVEEPGEYLDEDPFQIGILEWHNRYGESRRHARHNLIMALIALCIAGTALTGAGYLSTREQVVPHVVNLERISTHYETDYNPALVEYAVSQNQQRSIIRRFLLSSRRVTPDVNMHRQMQRELATFVAKGGDVERYLQNMFITYDRLKIARTHAVTLEITEYRKIAVNTWFVQWEETFINLQTAENEVFERTGQFTLARGRVTNAEAMYNPTGVIITDFSLDPTE